MKNVTTTVSSISYYAPKTKTNVWITSTNEKTWKDAEAELLPILESHYIEKLLRTPGNTLPS